PGRGARAAGGGTAVRGAARPLWNRLLAELQGSRRLPHTHASARYGKCRFHHGYAVAAGAVGASAARGVPAGGRPGLAPQCVPSLSPLAQPSARALLRRHSLHRAPRAGARVHSYARVPSGSGGLQPLGSPSGGEPAGARAHYLPRRPWPQRRAGVRPQARAPGARRLLRPCGPRTTARTWVRHGPWLRLGGATSRQVEGVAPVMRDKRRRPNSLDIAHLAGVSQSTVSRALRADPMVSACTRERVLEVARQLNYHVDKNASNLRRRHSGTLALLFFEDPTADDSAINPFFHSMLGSIIRACSRHGYDLLVSFQDLLRDWHADYEDSHKADGIILLGYGDYVVHRSRLQPLIERGAHLVRWGPVLADGPGLAIGCDNVFGGRQATEHLLRLGRRRIAFLGDVAQSSPEMLERYSGYARTLELAGLRADPMLQVG